ncbi:MAG: hypothetical protein ATN34_02325 [Epulopiscium sp. Nele67-Bin002]|nr:MAG: hypothetical protein ATN34_02325 [Epulopiscium sp. Nele67-Bin002]
MITIKEHCTAEIIEKKSRFIAYLFYIESPEQAENFLAQIRKQHYNASHNCYAYQIGQRDEIQRFSDDGEPQGTAGKPILEVLKGIPLSNTLIIITRYFGGTLLGTGGLVRAYGRAAKEGVRQAILIKKVLVQVYQLECEYTLFGKVEYLLKSEHYNIRHVDYTNMVSVTVEVLVEETDKFKKWIIDKTNAEVSLYEHKVETIDVPFTPTKL